MYETKVIPEYWNRNIIVPIYKKGEPSDLNNYRGITIINTAMKILCKVLTTRIADINQEFGLIRKEQAGFTRQEECVAHAATLLEIAERRR